METEQKKSTKELWIELGHLIVLLILAIIGNIFRNILKFLVYIGSLIKRGARSVAEWWKDKSTQEKIRSIRRRSAIIAHRLWKWTKAGCRTLWRWIKTVLRLCLKYSLLAIIYTYKGCVWLVVNLVQLIIHMKPTLIRLKTSLKEWKRRTDRGRRLKAIRRRRSYEAYKRNGGFRGSLERKSASLKSSIRSYMEEEDEEDSGIAVTEPEETNEEEDYQDYPDSKAQIIGKKFFSSIKGIVEDNK